MTTRRHEPLRRGKSLPRSATQALESSVDAPTATKGRTDWLKRDQDIVLTALLAELRAQKMRGAAPTHRRADVLHVCGKENKDLSCPSGPPPSTFTRHRPPPWHRRRARPLAATRPFTLAPRRTSHPRSARA